MCLNLLIVASPSSSFPTYKFSLSYVNPVSAWIAEDPLPVNTELAFNVVAPVPPLLTGKVPITSAVKSIPSSLIDTEPDDTSKLSELKLATPLFVSVASSPAIVKVSPLTVVLIPSPPAIVAENVVELLAIASAASSRIDTLVIVPLPAPISLKTSAPVLYTTF